MNKQITPPENNHKTQDSEAAPLFSIIIPIYNTEKYLRQCVDSVLHQSFTDYELWLIDDGSSDSSIDIIHEYAASDRRIHKAFIKGTGPTMPRNYGLDRAKGQFVLFVDSDDYLLPNALKKFADIIDKNPEIEFIKGNQTILMDDSKEYPSVFKQWRLPFAQKILSGEELMVNVLRTDFTPTNSIFKRELLSEHKLRFQENLVLLEDVPFIMEMCSVSHKCTFVAEETYCYRLFSETSLTRSKRTLPKVMSLAQVAETEKELADRFDVKGKDLALRRSTEHAVSALFQGCSELSREESNKVLSELKRTFPKLPRMGRSRRHLIGIFLYNLSPTLAHDMLRSLSKLI